MRKSSLLFITVFILGLAGKAQTAEDSVKAVINKMFTAMKQCDSAMLSDCFASSGILQSVQVKDGRESILNETVSDFAGFISKQQKNDLDEQITFDIIRIDDNLAIAWAPYKFYYKGKFSHCGVDSYQLVRLNGLWKIQYLIDTRHKSRCD
ncbi:MAG TPA: nuclear transport factor 2 family protein [Panacibacter sp.]|nr:nuclear transport factor 2 family protein [Panacibacter sp.]HNP45561.1 nuclear transport factor 2 family protein [Panacibacter sp.]